MICADVIKAIAALLSDVDQGPFRVLIIDSIICKLSYVALRFCLQQLLL